jgi:hypothetical protein
VLYRRCAVAFGWTPDAVDRLEVWQVAAALGEATHDLEEWAKNRPPIDNAGLHSSRDLVAERMAAARGDGPPVEADVMPGHTVFALQEAIRVG